MGRSKVSLILPLSIIVIISSVAIYLYWDFEIAVKPDCSRNRTFNLNDILSRPGDLIATICNIEVYYVGFDMGLYDFSTQNPNYVTFIGVNSDNSYEQVFNDDYGVIIRYIELSDQPTQIYISIWLNP
jgi:hypothetical protein